MPAPILATNIFKLRPLPNAFLRPGRIGEVHLLSAWIGKRTREDPNPLVAWLSLKEEGSEEEIKQSRTSFLWLHQPILQAGWVHDKCAAMSPNGPGLCEHSLGLNCSLVWQGGVAPRES